MTTTAAIDLSPAVWRADPENDGAPRAFHRDTGERVDGWAPFPGAQDTYLRSPCFETLMEGPRGSAKTTASLADFGQDVGTGLGTDWSGVMFRQSYKGFDNLVDEAKELYDSVWGSDVKFKGGKGDYMFTWPAGEHLALRVIDHPRKYWTDYHGQQIPWQGWEELTTWPDPECYLLMFSCCRSKNPRVRSRIRNTTNPGGRGHNWVMKRWGLPVFPGNIVGDVIVDGNLDRAAVHSTLEENLVLMHSDPYYVEKIRQLAAARGGEHLVKAWVDGSWDIVAGGMFDDVWVPEKHTVQDIPFHLIPEGWRIDRSYDHGTTSPFSVGWWAESNGEPLELEDGTLLGPIAGDLFRIAEWYGWTGKDNEGVKMAPKAIGRGIIEREADWGLTGRVKTGVADGSIFSIEGDPTSTVAGEMASVGVQWDRADRSPGSRKLGWERMRSLMTGANPKDGHREDPGLFICRRCYDGFLRTVPRLPRSERDPDDVDTNVEDHTGDEARYRCRALKREVTRRRWK